MIVPMPPYFPDLAPADIFLFPNLKSSLKGRRFQTVEEIEEKFDIGPSCYPAKHVPGRVPELENKRWERCIKSGGEYFEGDKFD